MVPFRAMGRRDYRQLGFAEITWVPECALRVVKRSRIVKIGQEGWRWRQTANLHAPL